MNYEEDDEGNIVCCNPSGNVTDEEDGNSKILLKSQIEDYNVASSVHWLKFGKCRSQITQILIVKLRLTIQFGELGTNQMSTCKN